MMNIALIAAIALAASQAQQTPSTEAPAEAAPRTAETARADNREDPDRVICRREHVVGSNRPRRICLPRREWDAIRDQSRDTMQHLQREQPQASAIQ